MDPVKRPIGRPPKSNLIDTAEEITAMNTETPAKSRGLREAAIRAEELRERFRKKENNLDLHDDFYIDPATIPDGWDYNWKRKTIAGATDPAYETELAQEGWEPVDASRHPELMPLGYKGFIERKGMILMERPAEISRMAEQRDLANAREAVEVRERAIGAARPGEFEAERRTVKKSYAPIPRE